MRRMGPAALLALLAAAAAVPWLAGPYGVTVATSAAMWVALTVSWSLLGGTTAYISLGHVVFYGLGAYLVAATWGDVPLWLAILGAGGLAGAFALLVGLPVLRVKGPYFVILTLGLAELVKHLVLNLEAGLGASSRLLFGAPGGTTLYAGMLALAVLSIALAWWVRGSRLGRGLAAIREDETAAETVGVPIARFKVAAYALSAVVPGMVGGLAALRSTYFEPTQAFSPVVSFTIVTMAIVGGSGGVAGPLMGALLLFAASELLWASFPQVYLIGLGVLLVGFVLFVPRGLAGFLPGARP